MKMPLRRRSADVRGSRSTRPFLYVFSAFLICHLPHVLQAQTIARAQLTGKLVDSASGLPIQGATVQVLKAVRNQPAGGTVTSESGGFAVEVEPGAYLLAVEHVGYRPYRSATLRLSPGKTSDLGSIALSAAAAQLEEVVVRAEKSSMQLALDKRIFNVGKDLANSGGNASDILMNIPSVSVDPEGTVRLRGSDNVRILIDGKPS